MHVSRGEEEIERERKGTSLSHLFHNVQKIVVQIKALSRAQYMLRIGHVRPHKLHHFIHGDAFLAEDCPKSSRPK